MLYILASASESTFVQPIMGYINLHMGDYLQKACERINITCFHVSQTSSFYVLWKRID